MDDDIIVHKNKSEVIDKTMDVDTIMNKNKSEIIEENNCNDETFQDSKFINSFSDNNISFNKSLGQSSIILNLNLEKTKKSKKEKKKKIPVITDEMKEEIESIVDKQFEEEYMKLSNEYENKIEELLNEQEKIFNKNEIIKAKYDALERYVKNYCKKANIDFESLLTNDE